MKYDSHDNITSLYKKFSENFNWISPFVDQSNRNRFVKIQSCLQDIAENYNANTNQVTKDFLEKEILLTSFEAKRFNQAIDYLRSLNPNHLPISKIRRMCTGPTYHLEEIPSTNNSDGRNIQFEFIFGALLKKAGFQIINFDDIQISYASSVIRFECKRPTTNKNISSRFDEAIEQQLVPKTRPNTNEYGIVALSIEKIDDFDKNLFQGNDANGVFDILIQTKNDVLNSLRDKLRIPSEKKILGLHIILSSYLWDKTSGTFMDITTHFTEKAVQIPATPLHDYLFDLISKKLK